MANARLLPLLLVLSVTAACAGTSAGSAFLVRPAAPRPVSLGEWEGHWLEELGATDPRLALRLPGRSIAQARERAAAEAVVRGADVGLVDGAIDVFSFDERARRLELLKAELRAAPEDADGEARAEKVLLRRLVEAEELRVVAERRSPEGASERVRAIVATWGQPRSTAAVEAREREVGRGLLGLDDGIRLGRLSRPRILELEDQLDALERLAVPEAYPQATSTITSLRLELEKAPTNGPRELLPPLGAQLEVYLGIRDDREALATRLGEEEALLRADAKATLARLPDRLADEARTAAAGHVDALLPCAPLRPGSLVRAMHAPPERAFVCDALEVVAARSGPLDEATAAVALHDDAAIALWALALAKGATDLDVIRTDHPLLASVPPGRQDRLVRSALVSPARALAPGMVALVLDAAGQDARQDRARRWLAYGDAPFDLVTEALAAGSESPMTQRETVAKPDARTLPR